MHLVFSWNLATDLKTPPRKRSPWQSKKKMSDETDLDELSIIKRGYERFLSSPSDLGNCENAIITVRRQQQITTHFGPLTTKNKIKVSLSQEQILNQTNRYPANIKRSQSTNIQKTIVASGGGVIRNAIRPSLIPVKIKEQPKGLRAIADTPYQDQVDVPKYRSLRKMSAPFERRNYVSQQESTLSSLPPIPMTQSLDPNLHSGKHTRDDRRELDRFKCGICLNILSDSRVLDCLHTFCLECLHTIENVNTPRTTPSKLNPTLQSNCSENKDLSSSNCSDESKESERKITKSIGSPTNKPIRRVSSIAKPKSLTMQQKRPLSSITEKSKVTLKCPICGLRTEIPIGGVSRVPKNFLLERELQHEIHKLQALCLNDDFCSQCYDEIEAVAYCLNCEISLCDVCHEAHLRQRWTSKHSLIAIPDLKSKQMDALKEKQFGLASNASLKCFIHPAQDIKLFCANCNQVACHNCTILLHKGHKFESIERAKQRAITKFHEAVERNQQFQEYLSAGYSKLANSILKINDKAEIVEMEIEIFLKDYFDALEAHRESLFRQIIKAKELKSLSIMEQQEYLQKRVQESQQANSFAQNLLLNGNDIEILTFIGILQNRFDFCQKAKMPVEPKFSDTFQFIREVRAPITPQQHNIPIYGVLATQEIDAT